MKRGRAGGRERGGNEAGGGDGEGLGLGLGVAQFGAGEIARGLAAEGEAGAFEIAEAALLDGLVEDGVVEIGGEFEGGGELFERGAMGGFDGDLAGGVAGAEGEGAGLGLAGDLEEGAAGFHRGFDGGLAGELGGGGGGFPERARGDAAVDFKGFAVRDDESRGEIGELDEGVAGDGRAGENPAF